MNRLPFLQARGLEIVDEQGGTVLLRGINLGCWLLIERWIAEFDQSWEDRLRTLAGQHGFSQAATAALRGFWSKEDSPSSAALLARLLERLAANGASAAQVAAVQRSFECQPPIADEKMLWDVLSQRFGTGGMESLRTAYREAWLTEADIAGIAGRGLNLVRVPFNYRVLEEPDGFSWLDRVTGWCARHGVYALLDMHGAPGGQNEADHSGQCGVNQLFHDESHLRRTVELWASIAARYAGHPEVCGYNLLNEPWGAPSPEALCDLYHRIIVAIRQVDPEHMIFLDDGFKGLSNMPAPARYGWENVVYAMHFYNTSASSPQDNLDYVERYFPYLRALQEVQGVPYYMGEFSTISEAQGGLAGMAHYLAAMNGYGWSWSPWTFKRVSPHEPYGLWGVYQINGHWDPPLVHSDSYETLLAKLARYRTENFNLNEAYAQVLRAHSGAEPSKPADVRVAAHLPDHLTMMRHHLTRDELDNILETLPLLREACGPAWRRLLAAEVYAFADPDELPAPAVSLLTARFGNVATFAELWYCILASQRACKSCDYSWSETAAGHHERLGIPYAMHPGNLSLLLEYTPRFKAFSY